MSKEDQQYEATRLDLEVKAYEKIAIESIDEITKLKVQNAQFKNKLNKARNTALRLNQMDHYRLDRNTLYTMLNEIINLTE